MSQLDYEYRCQRCKLPLIIHESLDDLSIAQSRLLISSINSNNSNNGNNHNTSQNKDELIGENPVISKDRLQLLQQASSNNKPLLNRTLYNETTDSYVLLPEQRERENRQKSLQASDTTMSDNINTLDNFFNIISSKQEIDYPICTYCANLLIEQMKLKLDQSVKEKDVYLQFLKKLSKQSGPDLNKSKEAVAELDRLKTQEKDLNQEFENLKIEEEKLLHELKELELENIKLTKEESEIWIKRNKFEQEVIDFTQERDSVNAMYEFNLNQLDKLRKSNVYNDTFKISHNGQFGTINGLRLGNADSSKISWHEINAALGQLILLLSTLVNKLNIKLDGYKLRPMASYSKIEKIDKSQNNKAITLECYSSGDSSFERLLNHYKFDTAMCTILDVVRQIGNFLKNLDNSIDLPYDMDEEKIGGLSIKLQSKVTSDEWTTACKYLLTNTKWILAYASAHSSNLR
ncbi:hypothetical protein PACTADRAFT_43813 [Pachysolen tannophilus NRRL Y-2460]|uniref:Uncharacterized protein n=1 Tax=Pachysolen tannophilus NRRL Y-2460 TaxID=669874 RepID=A0A1E4TTJ5_PACTA|nr:hypothetical protein PACTADRAFT_43813 [Pachysolen tannophilus NRRL Y-2460]